MEGIEWTRVPRSALAAATVLTALAVQPLAAAGVEVLGSGRHSRDGVDVEVIGTAEDGLDRPRDLAFNPDGTGELWVVNQAAPYRPADDEPWVAPPLGAVCRPGKGRRTTDPEFWSSTTTFYDVASSDRRSRKVVDKWAAHFLAEASSIAFGAPHRPHPLGGPSEPAGGPRTFATCGESRNEFKGCRAQNDFMGPALWTTDSTYGETNEHAVEALARQFCDGKVGEEYEICVAGCDLGSHLDMLHESPNCMGVAWERETVYWVFDGCGGSQWRPPADGGFRLLPHDPGAPAPGASQIAACKEQGDIVRYDFQTDHGRGFDNHCDGVIERYAVGVVKRVPGVPSHMEFGPQKRWLYVADSGNNRILALDTKSGGERQRIDLPPRENEGDACTAHWRMKQNAEVRVLVDGSQPSIPMELPSGLTFLDDDTLIVGDNRRGRLLAFDRSTGKLLDWVDLELPEGALMGIAAGPDKDLYAVDSVGDRLLRIAAPN